MKTQVHKVTILIVDHDHLGTEGIVSELEDARFANDCMNPHVMTIETREVDWTDEHPLNQRDTFKDAYDELFPEPFEGVY